MGECTYGCIRSRHRVSCQRVLASVFQLQRLAAEATVKAQARVCKACLYCVRSQLMIQWQTSCRLFVHFGLFAVTKKEAWPWPHFFLLPPAPYLMSMSAQRAPFKPFKQVNKMEDEEEEGRIRQTPACVLTFPSLSISHPASPLSTEPGWTFLRVNLCYPYLIQPLDGRAAYSQQTNNCSLFPSSVSVYFSLCLHSLPSSAQEVELLGVFTYCMFPLPRKPAEPLLCKHSQTHTHTHTCQTGRPYLLRMSRLGSVR